MAITWEDVILEFLREIHGTEMKKVALKFVYEHPRDVIQYSFLENLTDSARAARLRKLALLSGALEAGLNPAEIGERFDLDEGDVKILGILSPGGSDPAGYWERVFGSEDALIIKLGDCIANLVDLITSVGREGGFSKEAGRLYEKCAAEYDEFSPLISPEIRRLAESDSHPFNYQISLPEACLGAANALHLLAAHDSESFKVRAGEILDPFAEVMGITKYRLRFEAQLSEDYHVQILKSE